MVDALFVAHTPLPPVRGVVFFPLFVFALSPSFLHLAKGVPKMISCDRFVFFLPPPLPLFSSSLTLPSPLLPSQQALISLSLPSLSSTLLQAVSFCRERKQSKAACERRAMPLADRARSLFNTLPAVPSVPYPSTLIKRAGFGTSGGGGGGKGDSPRAVVVATTGGGGGGGLGDGRGQPDGVDNGGLTTTANQEVRAGAGEVRAGAGEGEIRTAGSGGDVNGGGISILSSSSSPSASAVTTTATRKTTGPGEAAEEASIYTAQKSGDEGDVKTSGVVGDGVDGDGGGGDDDDDVASTLEAVRTSLDAREMAAMGHSLDALEEIPTLSLEDFLRPAFMSNGGRGTATASRSSRHVFFAKLICYFRCVKASLSLLHHHHTQPTSGSTCKSHTTCMPRLKSLRLGGMSDAHARDVPALGQRSRVGGWHERASVAARHASRGWWGGCDALRRGHGS